jgi:hypothetical protein
MEQKYIDIKLTDIKFPEYLVIIACTKEEFEKQYENFSESEDFIALRNKKRLIICRNSIKSEQREIPVEEQPEPEIRKEEIPEKPRIKAPEIPVEYVPNPTPAPRSIDPKYLKVKPNFMERKVDI